MSLFYSSDDILCFLSYMKLTPTKRVDNYCRRKINKDKQMFVHICMKNIISKTFKNRFDCVNNNENRTPLLRWWWRKAVRPFSINVYQSACSYCVQPKLIICYHRIQSNFQVSTIPNLSTVTTGHSPPNDYGIFNSHIWHGFSLVFLFFLRLSWGKGWKGVRARVCMCV